MKYILNKYHLNITDEELIADLKTTAKKLRKKSLKYLEYDSRGKFSASMIAHRFGGWNEALRKAGLEIIYENNIPDAKLFENLKNVWNKLKRQPTQEDMVRPLSKHAASTYV